MQRSSFKRFVLKEEHYKILYETIVWNKTVEKRLKHLFGVYPDMAKKYTHAMLAEILGLERETITRAMLKMGYKRNGERKGQI